MKIFSKIVKRISSFLFPIKEIAPENAYDLWSNSYDAQPDNLMLVLDETVFSTLLNHISIQNKTIVDVGCGTGRHWNKIYLKEPAKLIGYDVSKGMLRVLQAKFPSAEIYYLENEKLINSANESCDIIICTLAIAHIENINIAFAEWHRVLKPGGEIILTDYHPVLLEKGGNRTFDYNGKKIAVKNYVYPLEKIRRLAKTFGFNELNFIEKKIDDSVKQYYEKQNALSVFERFNGTPVIYGMHLTKTDVIK
jgi:ubiquinone/menaquinone biosynthesis C-methylase UbiE